MNFTEIFAAAQNLQLTEEDTALLASLEAEGMAMIKAKSDTYMNHARD